MFRFQFALAASFSDTGYNKIGSSLGVHLVVQMSGEATGASADDVLSMADLQHLRAWNCTNGTAVEWVTEHNNYCVILVFVSWMLNSILKTYRQQSLQ